MADQFDDDSHDFEDGETTLPSTMRGRDWPALRQFGVFFENRVGQLAELLRSLEAEDLRIVGMSVADSIDYAVTRLILDDYERAVEIMEQSPFKTFETDIIGVELPDSDQPFLEICTALLRGEVNLQYAYPLLYHRGGRKAIAIYVDDIDQGIQVLQDRDITLLTEGDLDEDGEFF
ncbi:MAG: acetolactate synthase [Planctomycetaceae bacterium]|nr:acetolactate synthase [Planctomycetaceae bacterium]